MFSRSSGDPADVIFWDGIIDRAGRVAKSIGSAGVLGPKFPQQQQGIWSGNTDVSDVIHDV
jgi:hypothetical protein